MEIFTIADYLVFSAFLLLSTSIGAFFAFRDRKKATTDNYFYAGKKSLPFAVGMSMSATYLSAFAMIAVPAEVYMVGTAFASYTVGLTLASVVAITYFVSFFYQLEVSSVYEYLEMRFNSTARLLSAILVTVSMVIYAGMGVYLPALAVSAVAPISLTTSIIITGVTCTFYTTLGGMKAVIWTDMVQAVVMIVGALAVCVRTFSVIGGPSNLTESLEHGQRFTATKVDLDITSRTSPFAIFFDPFVSNLYLVAFTQPSIQRYKSCRTSKHARWAMLISIPPTIAITVLGILNGLLMFAYFDGCDPVKSGLLQSLDQGMPYIALQVFRDAPGAAGLFIAAIFSASFSTVSSLINSITMVILEDFVSLKVPNMSERVKILLGKVIVSMLGAVTIGFAFFFAAVKSNILRIFMSLMGTSAGPILGMFLCGLFLPWINAVGAVCGSVISFLVMTWITVGSMFFKTVTLHSNLPTFVDQCPVHNSTAFTEGYNISITTSSPEYSTTAIEDNHDSYTFDQLAYNISHFYYSTIATVTAIFFALVISLITGKTSPSTMDPKLFIPLLDSKIFPRKVRHFFRFGVPVSKMKKGDISLESSDRIPMTPAF